MAQGHKGAGMDAGLAAVLGALAGSVATIGAALATGWAQREGARITARSEHRRQRLEPRTAIYREYLKHATDLRAAVHHFSNVEALQIDQIDDDTARRIYTSVENLRAAWPDVALAGPDSIFEAAAGIYGSSLSVALAVREARNYGRDGRMVNEGRELAIRTGVARHSKELWEGIDKFVMVAQEALDDDGSRV
ncbi:hypothetical protein ACFVZC_17280 [Streptomyces marokkonensis]|uniref:Uncharacterized protein n=1 Tax=Streptomyces marokkonensis TaxID=324855 RepID=A0ABW6Q7I6_9ACTN